MPGGGARKCCLVSFLREYRDDNVDVKSYSAVRIVLKLASARYRSQKFLSRELVGKRYELGKFFAGISGADGILSETRGDEKVIDDASGN